MRTVKLGDVATFTNGGTPSRSRPEYWNGHIPWITGADMTEDGSISARSHITDAAVAGSATNVVPEGTVLLLTRTSVGKVGVLPTPMAINQDITAIQPSSELDTRFLVHFLISSKPRLLKNLRGATIKGVTRQDVASLRLTLPPLPEQRRIAAILDHADALRIKRRQVLAHLDALPQAIFTKTFGDPQHWSERWPVGTIGSLARSVDYGTSGKAGASGEWPILRMGNITDDGRIDLEDLKYIDLSPAEIPKYTVQRGDMLFNRTNSKEKVGKAAVVRTDQPLALAGYLVRARFEDSATAEFVAAYLTSDHGRALRQKLAKAAVNQANINATEMRAIPISLPSAELRVTFEARLARVEEQRTVIQRAIAADDELFASLQSRAFRGEL